MDLWVLPKRRILIVPLYRLLFSCAVPLDSADSFVSLSLLSVVTEAARIEYNFLEYVAIIFLSDRSFIS